MKKRVLIVDSQKDMREILRLYLSSLGDFEIFEASNGKLALETLKAISPDLVIVDLIMPQMNGWETLRAIRASGNGRRTPVIACSCLREDEARDLEGDIKEAGFSGYIWKCRMSRRSVAAALMKIGMVEGRVSL